MVKNPQAEQKIFEEIKSVLGQDVTELSDEEIMSRVNYETLSKFEYLESALLETLRLHPSVPQLVRFATQDIKLDNGKTINKGDVCVYVCVCLFDVLYMHVTL